MEKLFGVRKIFGELSPTDLIQGGLFGLGPNSTLHRVDLVMPARLESINRSVVDTLVCSELDTGNCSTLCFGSDFEKEILILSSDGKKQVTLKDCFKPSIFELGSATAPAYIKAQICKTEIDYQYLVDKIKNTLPSWKEISVLVNPSTDQIVLGFLWQAEAKTPGYVSTQNPGYFTSQHAVKIGKKKSSKRVYHYAWGNGIDIGRSQANMNQVIQNHIAAGFVLVDYCV